MAKPSGFSSTSPSMTKSLVRRGIDFGTSALLQKIEQLAGFSSAQRGGKSSDHDRP
jgi:hypothetical protein